MLILLAGCELPGGPVLLPTLSQQEVYLTAGITPFVSETLPPATPTVTLQPQIDLGAGYNPVYAYPEIGYPIRDAIRRGEAFEMIGRNVSADWIQIRFHKSTLAWIPVSSLLLIGQVDLSTYPQIEPYPAIPPTPDDWKGTPVQTLCLDEQITYIGTYAKENPQNTPETAFTPQIMALMHAMGIRTTPAPGSCDALLTIQTSIEPRGKTFLEAVTGVRRMCYSGVQITSKWELVQDKFKKNFSLTEQRGTVDHPLTCEAISQYQREMVTLIYTGISKLWGGNILPEMLRVNDPNVNELAIQLAGAGGRHSQQAIPGLIAFLDHPDLGVKAYRALKTITGKGYVKEAYLWKQWWDTQLTITPTP
jgi:hypothetical protein